MEIITAAGHEVDIVAWRAARRRTMARSRADPAQGRFLNTLGVTPPVAGADASAYDASFFAARSPCAVGGSLGRTHFSVERHACV
ncbi:hypothetical protein [Nonomuraea sp. NPDC049725]|uniref:hypothetical protein n=1 Tax=Nonomuraea sp. NPDC049725 TaxID=3154508 RepID=UPI003437119B